MSIRWQMVMAIVFGALALAGPFAAAPAAMAEGSVVVRLIEQAETDRARSALNERTTLTIERAPLEAALKQLAGKAGVKIDLAPGAFPRGVNPKQLVHVEVRDATFAEALEQVLDKVGLRYEVKAGAIRIRPRWTPADLPDLREEARRRIETALGKPVTLEFPGTSFDNVMDFVQDLTRLNIVIDRRASLAEGIGPDTTIKLKLTNVRLESALRLILEQVNLAYVIRYETLYITSVEQARLKRLEESLDRPVTLKAENRHLASVLLDLYRQTGLMVTVEPGATRHLPERGRAPVTLDVANVASRHVYEYLAILLGMRFVTEDGVARYEAAEAPAAERIDALIELLQKRARKGEVDSG